jgi:hypothetical protein
LRKYRARNQRYLHNNRLLLLPLSIVIWNKRSLFIMKGEGRHPDPRNHLWVILNAFNQSFPFEILWPPYQMEFNHSALKVSETDNFHLNIT